MSSTTERFKHESMEDAESIGKYLNALREGFENGALLFSSDNHTLVAKPKGLINVDVEAKRKNDEVKLTLKFRWSEAGSPDVKSRPLSIKPMTED